ncbi:MAG TPA: PilZ domain-containing protein [Myxococcota bacterium]|nr:PilZ domain-containing protein [Myxococcota bacterium]
MTINSQDESRRSTERKPLSVMVTYRLDGDEYGNLAADISPEGMFIRTFVPPEVGTRLDLTIELPGKSGMLQFDMEGEVVRVVAGEDPKHNGMGIHFTAIHVHDPEIIRQIVSDFIGFDE